MANTLVLESITEYATLMHLPLYHPDIAVFDMSKVGPIVPVRHVHKFNTLVLRKTSGKPFLYGDGTYRYRNGSVLAISPMQMAGPSKAYMKGYTPTGRVLAWSNDMFHGTRVGQMYFDYLFLSYRSNSSLDVNDQERTIIERNLNLLNTMLEERGKDVNILLAARLVSEILDTCMTTFKRQYDLYCKSPIGLLSRVESYVYRWFYKGLAKKHGQPRVSDLARECGLNSSYFGDRFRQLTGVSVKEYINFWTIEAAKEILSNGWTSLSDVACLVGFRRENHFSAYFKKATGMTPSEYQTNRFRLLRFCRTEIEDSEKAARNC